MPLNPIGGEGPLSFGLASQQNLVRTHIDGIEHDIGTTMRNAPQGNLASHCPRLKGHSIHPNHGDIRIASRCNQGRARCCPTSSFRAPGRFEANLSMNNGLEKIDFGTMQFPPSFWRNLRKANNGTMKQGGFKSNSDRWNSTLPTDEPQYQLDSRAEGEPCLQCSNVAGTPMANTARSPIQAILELRRPPNRSEPIPNPILLKLDASTPPILFLLQIQPSVPS